jgi:multisubunit Na+/H+ antiporter MnhC subunit
MVRDKIGDKKSLTLITVFLFGTLVLFGFSKNLIQMCITISLIGLASGVFVPGTAFMNWIEP